MNLMKLHSQDVESLGLERILQLEAHSVGVGLLLMVITLWVNYQLSLGPARTVETGAIRPQSPAEIVYSSSNVLFLCFGMTGIMILVNNNLARAFAIGAAIALVRFRIKVDSQVQGISLFYGVLCGMACGVDQPSIAWGSGVVFGGLQILVLMVSVAVSRHKKAP